MAERRREENLPRLKEEYEKVRGKYDLPEFDELDKEFGIRKIDYDLLLVREIQRIIMQRLDLMAAVLEPVLNPNPQSLHSYVESKVFSKQNIEPMFNFYKRLYHLVHKGICTTYQDEKAEAEWIRELWKVWPELKTQAANFTKQIADSWAKADKETFADRYLQ